MAASQGDTGFGTTITFASGFCAEVTSISRKGPTRKTIDFSHMTSPDGRMEKRPADLVDEGQYTVELHYIPGTSPPIDDPPEEITVTYPIPEGGSAGATEVCSGFLSDMGTQIPFGDKMTATCTLELQGVLVTTPAS